MTAPDWVDGYIAAGEEIVNILKAECEAGGILDGLVKPKHVFEGEPTTDKRAKLKLRDRALFVINGDASFDEAAVEAYEVPTRYYVRVWGRFPDIQESFKETLKAGVGVVKVFTRKEHDTLNGKCLRLHDEGGQNVIDFDPGYVPAKPKTQNVFIHWVNVSFYAYFMQDIEQ